MGYFSNGEEGMIYQERYCFNCRHWGQDNLSRDSGSDGCPIWDVHLLHAYDETDTGSAAEQILEWFIPREEPGLNGNGRCTMFVPKLEVVE